MWVPYTKVDVIRTHIRGIYIKIKYTGYLGNLLKLCFIIHLARFHIKEEYKLIKLGSVKGDYIIGYKSCQKLISLLMYEDYLMLYDVNITFNNQVYNNTFQHLEILIKNNTLVMNDSRWKMNLDECYWKEDDNQVSLIVHSRDQTCQWYDLLP